MSIQSVFIQPRGAYFLVQTKNAVFRASSVCEGKRLAGVPRINRPVRTLVGGYREYQVSERKG